MPEELFQNKRGLFYTIQPSSTPSKCLVTFLETGYTYGCRKDHALKGCVYDPLSRTKHGVGFTGVGQYSVKEQAYSTWSHMMNRVYDGKHPAYKSTEVCKEWKNYQNFAAWFYLQEWEKSWHLDKDLLTIGNRMYSPESCCFIPMEINQSIVLSPTFAVRKYHNKFGTKVNSGGTQIWSYFDNFSDAANFYCQQKDIRIKYLANKYKNVLSLEVIEALSNFRTFERCFAAYTAQSIGENEKVQNIAGQSLEVIEAFLEKTKAELETKDVEK